MAKIKSLSDLRKMKEDLRSKVSLRENSDKSESVVQIKVGMATTGIVSGAKEIYHFFYEELTKRNIDAVVSQTGDMGYPDTEPTIEITLPGKEPIVFGRVNKEKADEIIEKYIRNGELIDGIIPQNNKTKEDK